MKVIKSMKELEKAALEHMKKQIPSVTKDYSHKWYRKHPEIKEIVSETEFVKMVNDSMKITVRNGKCNAEFGIFQKQDLEEEHVETMNVLWEDFVKGYKEYIKKEVFK